MKRTIGITVIGCWCLIAGVYLSSIATLQLITPKAIPSLRILPFVRSLRMASPYLTFLIGSAWSLIAWGLFQTRNWARVSAQALLGFGAFWEMSLVLFHPHSTWQRLAGLVEVGIRLVAILYLTSDKVLDAFHSNVPTEL